MKKEEIFAIGIISGVLLLATCVAVGGAIAYATGFWHKNTAPEIKTKKESSVDNPEMFNTYMLDMQKRIKLNWKPSKENVSKNVTLLYSINKDGSLKRYSVLKSSGNTKMDESAVEALKKSFPFKPLPKDFKGEYIDVQFTFDYNVWEKKK